MIDWIISSFQKLWESKSDKTVKKYFVYVEGSTKLFVMIAPYRSDVNIFRRLEKLIHSRGQSFIAYRFPGGILTSDKEMTRKDFEKIRSDIDLDLKYLEKEYGFNEIEMLGFSLSCVPTLMIANGNPLINEVELVVPGHCLAESLWFGVRTNRIRKEFQGKGVTLIDLKEYWKDLAPENNIDKLYGKKISIFISEADMVIPYRFGMSLVESLKKTGVPFKLKTNKHLGHYLTAVNFLLHPSKFI